MKPPSIRSLVYAILSFAATSSGEVQLVNLVPSSGQTVGTTQPEMIIECSGAIDLGTATTESIRLYRIGDQVPTPGPDDTLVALASITPEEGGTRLRVTTEEPLQNGRYAWVIYGTGTDRSGPGNGLYFSDDKAYLNTAAFKTLADEFTIEAWTRFIDWSEQGESHTLGAIFDAGEDGSLVPGFWLSHQRADVHFGFRLPDGTEAQCTAEHALAKLVWRHLAGVSSPEGLTIYVDGQPAASLSTAFRPDSFADSMEVALVGYSRGVGSYNYRYFVLGMFDEMRVWNVARTEAEIVSTMYTPLSGNEPGLLVYHPLDEAGGSVLTDVTGHGYDGNAGSAVRQASNAPLIEMSTVALLGADAITVDVTGLGQPGGVLVSPFQVDITPPRIVSLDPDLTACDVLVAADTLAIGFDDEIDRTTLVAANASLLASGGDGTFSDGNELPIALADPACDAERRRVTFTLDPPLANEAYRFTLTEAVRNLAGTALDGEYPGAGGANQPLPSGDGNPGGDFVIDFVVDSAQDCNENGWADTCDLMPGWQVVERHSVRAYIDDHDHLIIKGKTVQWHHFSGGAAPGRHGDGSGNEPTYIDGVAWYPTWPEPPPSPIGYEAYSSIYSDLSPRLPARETDVQLNIIASRDLLEIRQLPTVDNEYTLIVEIDDSSAGPWWHEFEVVVTCAPATDCNYNGRVDECEIVEGTAEDCNSDGMPDECQLEGNDCNDNTAPDDCDIAFGTSQDCNANLVPDECDLSTGASRDCDSNQIPDECELDCNENGVPDACDISEGVSDDCNSNGYPDECELPVIPAQITHGPFFNPETGHAYFLTSSTTWPDAEMIARSMHGHLATVGDWLESAWIAVTFSPLVSGEPLHIGLTDSAVEGVWEWVSGEPLTLTNWCFGEPNDNDGAEDYTEFQMTQCWNDIPRHWTRRGLVELPVLSFDCNDNATPDECDIVGGASGDCNRNGIPDECDPDGNHDGIPDDCDRKGDFDHDADVDLDDYQIFEVCLLFSGPGDPPPFWECRQTFDFDGDSDVDLGDFAALQVSFVGQ